MVAPVHKECFSYRSKDELGLEVEAPLFSDKLGLIGVVEFERGSVLILVFFVCELAMAVSEWLSS